METNTVVRVDNISFSYGKNLIFSEVSFDVSEGQCIGIIGLNGSGKTTLFHMLAGLKKGTTGSITYEGEEIFPGKMKRAINELIGYVPQFDFLTEELTVWDNLLLWYMDKQRLERQLQEGLLKQFGLWEMRKKKVSNLSGGMRKKVSIACALAKNPKVLILDEPSASLDLEGKREVRESILKWKEEGKCILLSTHENEEIKLCNEVYILKDKFLQVKGET